MNKIWKIGTNVGSYIDTFNEWKTSGIQTFEIEHQNEKEIRLVFNNETFFETSKSTAMQLIRVLLSFGLIKANKESFKFNKSVIASNVVYELAMLNREESVFDFIATYIEGRVQQVFEKDNLIYPDESNFYFSLLGTMLSITDPKHEKFINMRAESGELAECKKYYEGVAKNLLDSLTVSNLCEAAEKYIIGFSAATSSVVKSINGDIAKSTQPIYQEINLENEVETTPYTFATFMKAHFGLNSSIQIPIYQRKYIWKQENVKNLLLDIYKCDKYKTHYIGNIITQESKSKKERIYKIIDGQQRITTLVLILRALFDYSKFKGFKVDGYVNSLFDQLSEESLNKSFSRIEGNPDYDAFNLVITGKLFTAKKAEYSVVAENFKLILDWIVSMLSSDELIKKFWDSLLNRISMVAIDVKQVSEYDLFEKLNTGAVPLNTVELFKNFIFDRASKTDGAGGNINEKKAQAIFEDQIYSKFSGANKDKDVEKFIICSLRVHNSKIADTTPFAQYKDLIETKYITNGDAEDFTLEEVLESIGREIDIYNEISNYEKYNDKKSWAYPFWDFFYMLDGRSVYLPLVIKLLNFHFNANGSKLEVNKNDVAKINHFREFLRVIEIFEVRMQIATYRGQSLSSKIEDILENVTEDTTPSDLWKLFKGDDKNVSTSTGLPSVEKLYDTLLNSEVLNKPAKLIMTRIENYNYLGGWDVPKNDYSFRASFTAKSQREHLLPANWEANWKSYLEKNTGKKNEELEAYVNKYLNYIGNAFPIPAWSNQSIKDSSFDDKLKEFKKQAYSKDVCLFWGLEVEGNILESIKDSFTPETIIDRTKAIANIAKKIWEDFE